MKLSIYVCSLAFTLAAIPAFARPAKKEMTEVGKLSAVLAKVLDGQTVTELDKGTTAKSLIEQKYMKDNKLTKLDEDFEFTANAKSIQESDGSGMGTASLNAAKEFVQSKLSAWQDEDGTSLSGDALKKKQAKAAALLDRLDDEGAEFGYDSNGGGACGVNFTSLFVIDKKAKTIHEFLVVSGPC